MKMIKSLSLFMFVVFFSTSVMAAQEQRIEKDRMFERQTGSVPDLSQFNKAEYELQEITSIEHYGVLDDRSDIGHFVVEYADNTTWDSKELDIYPYEDGAGLAVKTLLDDLYFAVRTDSTVYLYDGAWGGVYIIETKTIDENDRVNKIKFTNDVFLYDTSIVEYTFTVNDIDYEIDTGNWPWYYETMGSKIITELQMAFESGSDITISGSSYTITTT